MNEYIKTLKCFKEHPLDVLEDDKKKAKLMAAINKSIKLLHKEDSKKRSKNQAWFD